MKYLRFLLISLLLGAMFGCSHGYEGEFEGKVVSNNALVNAVAGASGIMKITIGDNYLESDGSRKEFDDIFVRDSGDDSYLVFKDGSEEEAWKIIDDDTLLQDHGMMQVKLERVK